MTITGRSLSISCKRRQSSTPGTRGICRSVTTTSGNARAATASAASPSGAADVSKPSPRSIVSSAESAAWSSSTTRTRGRVEVLPPGASYLSSDCANAMTSASLPALLKPAWRPQQGSTRDHGSPLVHNGYPRLLDLDEGRARPLGMVGPVRARHPVQMRAATDPQCSDGWRLPASPFPMLVFEHQSGAIVAANDAAANAYG